MVGKRSAFSQYGRAYSTADIESNGSLNGSPRRRRGEGDLESGRQHHHQTNGDQSGRPRPRIWRFQDDVRPTALDDERRNELKKFLLHGIDRTGLEQFRKTEAQLKAINNKKVRAFYEAQNERLNDWLEVDAIVMAIADDVLESMDPDPDRDGIMERRGGLMDAQGNILELLPQEEKQKRAQANRRARWAININVIANILLLIGKAVAAASTGSLSLLASLVDSALDLLCTLIIWTTTKLVQWRLNSLKRRFPVGRRRLEPLGIVVFSIIMVISFVQILQESVQKLAPLHGEVETLSVTAIAALLVTIILKGAIGICCYPIKTTQVQALVQDCKTDVIFNSLSLFFPWIGSAANVWWLDPAGAALLSLFIIYDWGQTCFENVTRLSGEAASEHTLKKLMYLAYRFAPVVQGVKNIMAYHAGDGVWAEFDILLDGNTPLHQSHDIAKTLQYCAEGLAEVDRAFVTTDYSSSGPLGHAVDAETNN